MTGSAPSKASGEDGLGGRKRFTNDAIQKHCPLERKPEIVAIATCELERVKSIEQTDTP